MLLSLQPHCSRLTKLDLSWCGITKGILSTTFNLYVNNCNNSLLITILLFIINSLFRFIRNCGTHLTHLRLDSCAFVNDTTLIAINLFCKYLNGIVTIIVKNTHRFIGVYVIFRIEFEKLYFDQF